MARKPRNDANTVKRIADVVGRGAQLIRGRGHCIGALEDDSGRLCLMGAIREAARDETRDIRFAAYDEVNQRLRRPDHAIHTWNDEQTDPGRVADLLDGVARELDPAFRAYELCWHGRPLGLRCDDCRAGHGRSLDEDKPLCPHVSVRGLMCITCRQTQAAAYLAAVDGAGQAEYCIAHCWRGHTPSCPVQKVTGGAP